ncbi:MAG: FAD-linked oxidase C-terminal domain-containing protein, partial [Victivallales bacterium]|nr:FAD-linked oxidase C-terminal domain-containing protein [Victivallales bacterium]
VWQQKLEAVFSRMYARGDALGGLVSGEHGIGYAKKTFLAQSMGQTGMELLQRIKLAFDPNNILNPGKVCR